MTDWTKDFDAFLAEDAQSRRRHDADQARDAGHGFDFITGTVLPAFAQLKANLERPGRDRRVDVQRISPSRAQLTIGRTAATADGHGETLAELQYTVELAVDPATSHALKIVDDGDGAMPEALPHEGNDHPNQALIVNDVLRHWQQAVREQSATR